MSRAADYEAAAAVLLRESGCVVRKWRSRNTGTAYVRNPDWEIEAPRPRGAISFAVLAHEVGHQLHHRPPGRTKPRWLEEVEAWEYALAQFDRFGLDGRTVAEATCSRSLMWAYHKAVRRGADGAVIQARFPAFVADHAKAMLVDRRAVEHLDA